ncbi:hypothetical protein TWF594_005685 [Orbilia oligospora]|nr:hypothetical protein TWF594_005685 [Orbilia oligospora]
MVAQHIFHVIQVISSARADPIFLLPRLILVQNGHDGWFVVSWFPRRQTGRILGTSLQTSTVDEGYTCHEEKIRS